MRNLWNGLALILALAACTKDPGKDLENAMNNARFAYGALQEFQAPTEDWETQRTRLQEVPSVLSAILHLTGSGQSDGISDSNDKNYLYSFQSKTSGGYEFTILSNLEDFGERYIRYVLMDSTGRKTGEFIAAASGGEGGDVTRGYGRFRSKHTYDLTLISLTTGGDEEDGAALIGDSTTIRYTITSNGSIQSDTLSRIPVRYPDN